MFYLLLRIIFSPFVKLIWIRRVEGLENIPTSGKIIIASNHESYFDFLCFPSICPRRIYYLAGEVFFKKWWWAPLVILTGQIRVDRDKKNNIDAVNSAMNILNKGQALGIFPEGTRSSDGKLQKGFTGVAKFALSARSHILPVGMIGTYEIMSRFDKFPRLKKCEIRIGKPLDYSKYYGKENDKSVLRLVTDDIMKHVAYLTGEKYNF